MLDKLHFTQLAQALYGGYKVIDNDEDELLFIVNELISKYKTTTNLSEHEWIHSQIHAILYFTKECLKFGNYNK